MWNWQEWLFDQNLKTFYIVLLPFLNLFLSQLTRWLFFCYCWFGLVLAESYFFSFQEIPRIFHFTPDAFGSDNPLLKVVGAGNIPVLLLEQNTCCA